MFTYFLQQLTDLTGMYDDIQDRIWEIEKSWRNNLIFHGIRYDDPNVEEDPNRTEEKVRTVIRVDLQLSREIPILRAHRIKNGPLVKGTHPILGIFLCTLAFKTRKPRVHKSDFFQCLSKIITIARKC